jgi:predicted amidohydrolase
VNHDLDLVIHQCDTVLGDPGANRALMEEAVRASPDSGLVVFPELALTGYSVRDGAGEVAIPLETGCPLTLPQEGPAVALGFVERGDEGLVYNSAAVYRGNQLLHNHRKVYLPTYGIFEEGHFFAPGKSGVTPFDLAPGWRVGLLICEDFWHPALSYILAMQEIDLLLVLSAAPGRGRSETEEGEVSFESSEPWVQMARATALQYGIFLVLCNRAGVEGELTFAGGSMVVGPDGRIVVSAPEGKAARLEVTLAEERILRARDPFSHLREEDPARLKAELDRLLGDG